MKKLQLSKSRSGEQYYALIDDDYFEFAIQYKYYANVINGFPYAARNIRINAFKTDKRLLHREVYEFYHGTLPPHKKIQFINNNTLDCQIKNLYLKSNLNDTDDKKMVSKKVVK